MKCPVCGGAKLETGSKDVPYVFHGCATVLRSINGQHCPACGETVMNSQESEALMYAIKAFKLTLNVGQQPGVSL